MIHTYYHGTSADHLESILKYGIKPVPDNKRIWIDSNYNLVYLWKRDINGDGSNFGWILASESAACTLPFSNTKRLLVVTVQTRNVYDEDTSGENMASSGAVQTWKVPPRLITKIEMSEDLSCIIPMQIKLLMANNLFRQWKFSDLQRWSTKHIKLEDFFMSEMPIFWETVYVRQTKKEKV